MIHELTCICCPKGCRLKVDDQMEYNVMGNGCERGAEYGKNEIIRPMRVLTSTVVIRNAVHPRLPVKTDRPIDRHLLMQAMDIINSICVVSPVHCGDIIIKNILDAGVNLIACKDM